MTMPMAYCERFRALEAKWIREYQTALAEGANPDEAPPAKDALARLRAHAEICEQCIGALFEVFPETAGKKITMQSLLEDS